MNCQANKKYQCAKGSSKHPPKRSSEPGKPRLKQNTDRYKARRLHESKTPSPKSLSPRCYQIPTQRIHHQYIPSPFHLENTKLLHSTRTPASLPVPRILGSIFRWFEQKFGSRASPEPFRVFEQNLGLVLVHFFQNDDEVWVILSYTRTVS